MVVRDIEVYYSVVFRIFTSSFIFVMGIILLYNIPFVSALIEESSEPLASPPPNSSDPLDFEPVLDDGIEYVLFPPYFPPPLPAGWLEVPGGGRTDLPLTTTFFDGQVYVFAVGQEGRIWFQIYDLELNTWLRDDQWTEVPGGGFTDTALAVTSSADAMYLFAVGKEDRQVYYNKKSLGGGPTDGWSVWKPMPLGGTKYGVSAVSDNLGKVHVFRIADDKLYYTKDLVADGGWTVISSIVTKQPSGAVFVSSTGVQFFFIQNEEVYSAIFNIPDMRWQYCGLVGEQGFNANRIHSSYAVAPVIGYSNSLYLFHTGRDNRIRAQLRAQNKCTLWTGESELRGAGSTNKAPAVTSIGGNLFMVFVKGIKTPGIYYHFFSENDIVSEVNTRGHFRTSIGDGGELLPGHTKYDYETIGRIRGLTTGTSCPGDLAIAVHGWDNTPQEAQRRALRAKIFLRELGYNGEVVGFSWDSDTTYSCFFPPPWPEGCGFDEGKDNGKGNGPKLANFIDHFKKSCPSTKIHLMAHSMGGHSVLEAIKLLAYDGYYSWNRDLRGVVIDDVHLMGAAVDDNRPQTNDFYGIEINAEVGKFYNYFSSEDDELSTYYFGEEGSDALGESGIDDSGYKPINYEDVNVESYLPDGGDDHFAYWGYLGPEYRDKSVRNPYIIALVRPRFS